MAWTVRRTKSRRHFGATMASLERLDKDYTQGVLTKEEYLDSISEIQHDANKRFIRPKHTFGIGTSVTGFLLILLRDSLDYAPGVWVARTSAWLESLPILGIALMVTGAIFLSSYFKRLQDDAEWFNGLRRTIREGGHLVDFLQEEVRRIYATYHTQ